MKDKSDTLRILGMIIDDCEKDTKDFEGKEFNGRNVATIHGILEAKIQALAKILKEIVTQQQEVINANLPQ